MVEHRVHRVALSLCTKLCSDCCHDFGALQCGAQETVGRQLQHKTEKETTTTEIGKREEKMRQRKERRKRRERGGEDKRRGAVAWGKSAFHFAKIEKYYVFQKGANCETLFSVFFVFSKNFCQKKPFRSNWASFRCKLSVGQHTHKCSHSSFLCTVACSDVCTCNRP